MSLYASRLRGTPNLRRLLLRFPSLERSIFFSPTISKPMFKGKCGISQCQNFTSEFKLKRKCKINTHTKHIMEDNVMHLSCKKEQFNNYNNVAQMSMPGQCGTYTKCPHSCKWGHCVSQRNGGRSQVQSREVLVSQPL